MRESYVHPVVRAREPRPEWIAVWRFRLAALLILILATLAVIRGYNILTGANRQDPSFDADAHAAAASRY